MRRVNFLIKILLFVFLLNQIVFGGTESEWNGNKYNANPISINSETTGTTNGDDPDFFSFTAPNSGEILIKTTNYSKKMSIWVLKGCGYDSRDVKIKGTNKKKAKAEHNGDDVEFLFDATSGQEYCVKLKGSGYGSKKSYILHINEGNSNDNGEDEEEDNTILTEDNSLCYGETTHSGFCFGMFGIMCTTTTPIYNISNDTLTDTIVSKVYTNNINGSFLSSCGIDGKLDNQNCSENDTFSMPMVSIFGKGIDYTLGTFVGEMSHTILDKSMMEFSMSGVKFVADYKKNNNHYQVELSQCGTQEINNTINPTCLSLDDALQTFEDKIHFGANAQVENPDDTLPSSDVTQDNPTVNSCKLQHKDCVKDRLVPEPNSVNIKNPNLPNSYDFGNDRETIDNRGTYNYSDLEKLTIDANTENVTIKPNDSQLNINRFVMEANTGSKFTNSSDYTLTFENFTTDANTKVTIEKVSSLKAKNITIGSNSDKFELKADDINIDTLKCKANGNFIISPNRNKEVLVKIKTLEFTANATVQLSAGDYYIDNLIISANINLKPIGDGTVRIYTNSINVSANPDINKNGNPTKVLLFSNGDITLGANNTMALVVVSKGTYTQNANGKLLGAVLAKEISIGANGIVKYYNGLKGIDVGNNFKLCSAVEDEEIPTDDLTIEEFCNTFGDGLQTREDQSKVDFSGGSGKLFNNPDKYLNTFFTPVNGGPGNDITCQNVGGGNESAKCLPNNIKAKKIGPFEMKYPAEVNITTPVTTSTTDLSIGRTDWGANLASGTPLEENDYNQITTTGGNGSDHINFVVTGTLKVNSIQTQNDENITIMSSNGDKYNILIGTLQTNPHNVILVDSNVKNIKIKTLRTGTHNRIILEANQTIKIDEFDPSHSGDINLTAPYININSFKSDDSGSNPSIVNIKADYIDIGAYYLGDGTTLTIQPFTEGKRVIVKMNRFDTGSHNTINFSAGTYYIKTLDTQGSGEGYQWNMNGRVNLIIENPYSTTSQIGINSDGTGGNNLCNDSHNAYNLLMYVKDDVRVYNNSRIVGMIYSEKNVYLNSASFIKGAVSAKDEIILGNDTKVCYDSNLGGFVACEETKIPDYPSFAKCGLFPSALSTWEGITTGNSNNREVINSDTIYGDYLTTEQGNPKTLRCILPDGSSQDCLVEEMDRERLTLPSFLETEKTTTNSYSSGTLSDYEYGNLSLSGNITFRATTNYNNNSHKLMKIGDITISGNSTLTFKEGDYWIKSLHSENNNFTLRVDGKVRLFIQNDLILDRNDLDFNYDNGNGKAGNLYIFVYGDFTTTSAGGGSNFKLTAYVYTQGKTTITSNTENHYFKGAFTSEDEIITSNNQTFEYDSDGLDDEFGSCNVDFICPNPRRFTQRTIANKRGDIELIGNTILCKNQGGHCVGASMTENNNNINMMFIDADGNSDTFNSSSARLNLPENSTILWAGLYWQGYLVGANDTTKKSSGYIKYGYTPIKDATPTTYERKRATNHNWVYFSSSRWYYQGFVDITSFVKSHGDGWYWVADLVTGVGKPIGGSFGAWSIAVVYENSNKKLRNLTIYDGYIALAKDGGNAQDYLNSVKASCPDVNWTGVTNQDSVPLSGFVTPTSGDVNSILFAFTGEGDIKLTGDKLKLSDRNGDNHNMSDGVNPSTNVFNASISKNGNYLGADDLNPYYSNNSCGIDIDTFNVSSVIGNNQRETTVTMNSTGDGYFPGMFGFATDLYEPRVCYQENYYYIRNSNNSNDNSDDNDNSDYGFGNVDMSYLGSVTSNSDLIPVFDPVTHQYNQNLDLEVGDELLLETEIKNLAKEGDGNIEPAEGVTIKNYIDKINLEYVANSLAMQNIGETQFTHYLDLPNDGLADLLIDERYPYDGNITLFRVGEGADNWYGGKLEPYSETANNKVLAREKVALIMPGDKITLKNIYKASYYNADIDANISDLTIYPCEDYNLTLKVKAFEGVRIFDGKYKNKSWKEVWDNYSSTLTTKIAPINNEYCLLASNRFSKEDNGEIAPYSKTAEVKITLVDVYKSEKDETGMANSKILIDERFEILPYESNGYSCFTLDKSQNGALPTISKDVVFKLEPYTKHKVPPVYSDHFAIRPKKFSIISPNNGATFKAGTPFDFKIKSLDRNGDLVSAYDGMERGKDFIIEVNESKSGCISGDLNLSVNKFTNGLLEDNSKYSEIGNIKVTIKEIEDEEFARIDKGNQDCDKSCYLIEEDDLTLNFTPSHFELNATLINHDTISNFTYLSNNLNDTKGRIELKIVAKNQEGNITKNYSKECYAKNGNLGASLNSLPSDVKSKLEYLRYFYQINGTTSVSQTIPLANLNDINMSISKQLFNDGRADVNVSLNFDRKIDTPVRPFVFNLTNTTYKDSDGIEATESSNNGSLNFYYGRVHSPNLVGTSPLKANIYYEIYLVDPDNDVAGIAGKTSIDSFEWRINSGHHDSIDGRITGVTPTSSDVDALNFAPTQLSGINVVSGKLEYKGSDLPFKDTININSSDWLIYNKFNSNASHSSFTAEFITGNKNWSGVGEEAKVAVDSNTSRRTTRKLEW